MNMGACVKFFLMVIFLVAIGETFTLEAAENDRRSVLILKNGAQLYNYRISSVIGGNASIAYTDEDGDQDLINVPIDFLPEELKLLFVDNGQKNGNSVNSNANTESTQQKNMPSTPVADWKKGQSLREKLILAAQQLVYDLFNLKNDRAKQLKRTQLLVQEIRLVIASAAEKIDFQEVDSDAAGVLVRVTGTGVGSTLHTNDLVYISPFKLKYSAVGSMTLYPTGDFIKYKKATVPVYSDDVDKAVVAAARFMRDCIDDPALDYMLLQAVGEDDDEDDDEESEEEDSENTENTQDDASAETVKNEVVSDDDAGESADDASASKSTDVTVVNFIENDYNVFYGQRRPVYRLVEPGPRFWRPVPRRRHHMLRQRAGSPHRRSHMLPRRIGSGGPHKPPVNVSSGNGPRKSPVRLGQGRQIQRKTSYVNPQRTGKRNPRIQSRSRYRRPFQHNRLPLKKTIISKGNGSTSNYGLLPAHLAPGKTGRPNRQGRSGKR